MPKCGGHALTLLVLAAAIATAALIAWPRSGIAGSDCNELQFEQARLYIEFNSTDEDVGVQVFVDGEAWRSLRIFNPESRKVLDVRAKRSLRQQGLSEFFFESDEPDLSEVPLSEFLQRFPAGEYEFEGVTVEGDEIEGEAELSHTIPAGPEVVVPDISGDDPPVVDPGNFMIEWLPVSETITGSGDLQVVGYRVIVVQEEPLREFQIELPASVTSVTVPSEFFEQPDTLHTFEVLAIEEGGNQTITEGEFLTSP